MELVEDDDDEVATVGERKGRGKTDNKRLKKKSPSPVSRRNRDNDDDADDDVDDDDDTRKRHEIPLPKDAPSLKKAIILDAIKVLAGPLAIRRDLDEEVSYKIPKGVDPIWHQSHSYTIGRYRLSVSCSQFGEWD
ncbi:MAG: hypothetical protein GY738_30860 [Pseudoalteromonas sp.]|nr:hypothetical protein [Pseudoalteromonas sp.]